MGREALGGFLRNAGIGGSLMNQLPRQDAGSIYTLTPEQLDTAWQQVQVNFGECPTCQMVVCRADFDVQSGYCYDDSPRREEIAQAETEKSIGAIKGIADAFGFGDMLKGAAMAAKTATAQTAHCPKDGTQASAGTKFCPECGSAMVQPTAAVCPQCGVDVKGAKFCPECGAKIERAAAPTNCANCGVELKGAKFCPECGTKAG
jgi:ribosomal protein L33